MVKVSVIICTYNGASYLAGQLDSLLAQTCPPYELVVQDDGSSDGTWEMLEAFRAAHPGLCIRLFRNPERLGYNRNFLSAVQRASGDFIACCDQDDLWHPEKLEMLAREIGNAPLDLLHPINEQGQAAPAESHHIIVHILVRGQFPGISVTGLVNLQLCQFSGRELQQTGGMKAGPL